MSFFRNQLADVVEWQEFRDDMIFWKWPNREIKRGSRLMIQPGQDAIFFSNGKIEGIFEDDGEYNIESEIIPFLSTLKGFKFGFNTGLRVEVLFVNTKQFTVKWGTKNAINIPSPSPALPGGIPIRANGTFNFKVNDYVRLIENVAGVKKRYLVEDVKIRITTVLDQLLMKWIAREGKDMFNLQANSFEISQGIQEDLDMEVYDLGLSITGFNVNSFNYPKEIQDMITKAASQGMVGDVAKYQQIEMTDGIASGKVKSGGTASDMAGMMMGMNVANEMMKNMKQMNQPEQNQQQQPQQQQSQRAAQNESSSNSSKPNFCPNCGQKTDGANFCSNCGEKL
ncbi:SPFH domain-containing protein [Oceanobacillus alkalisoli]|uniref:SPFH domain-containing protein n=1 Tax=Oceanobacillus alkalisoli TaxID=2925113 RepID=UPI001EF07CF2|nr:SPFH domain-containing protein [Oceanobacillus alkalisoli]MCF3944965.1 SPFH domain-containing protein [Oceanobacillus alkalisoli]MCG5105245.1 SPFH domain-containing protein [Oceanobacillus alkalisoli]